MSLLKDESVRTWGKSKFKTAVLIAGPGLFVLSLFNNCFCTDNGYRTSPEAFSLGWLAMLTGGASIAWLANPAVIVAWILLIKDKKRAWLFALAASVISISFLAFKEIIADEAGHYTSITSIGPGYWLWLSSCLATFVGSLILRIVKGPNFK